ncbi:MAG: UbiA family prenyltransferase [Candidatus Heimdallarchaeaceae archaeon]
MSLTKHSKKDIFLSYITILRLVNGIVAGTAAIFAIILSTPVGAKIDYITLLLVLLSGTLVSSQAMIFNDIADREEDLVNAPHRPIPSKKISVRTAVIYGVIVALIALILALLIDIREGLPGISVITALIFGSSLNLYNFKVKQMGFFGNVLIGLNVIALFVYGSLFSYFVYQQGFTWVPTIVGLAAASGNVGREVIKGLPDIEGDKKAGNKTIAVLFGPRVAGIVGAFFLLGLAGGAIGAMIIADLYLPSLIIAIILAVLVLGLAIAIIITQNPKWAYTTKEILLIVFLVFLLDFIIDAIIKLVKG